MDEATPKEESPKEESKLNKKLAPYLLIGLIAGVMVALIITLVVAITMMNRPIPSVLATQEGYSEMVPMREFIVNLLDMGGRRYLKIQIDFEVETKKKSKGGGEHGDGKAAIPEEIKEKESILRNYIINILSNNSASDIRTIEGKNDLRKAILVKSNFILKNTKVLNVYFNDFIIQ